MRRHAAPAHRPGRNTRHGANRGFTLIELVAALAIFALVAVMAAQALNGALRQHDALAARDDAAIALGRSLTLLRRDLEAALPLVFLRPDSNAPEPALRIIGGAESGFALSIGGHPALPGEPGAGMARVEWRIDPGREMLIRQHWSGLAPGSAGPRRDMIDGVTALSIEPLGAWPDPVERPDALPEGFAVVIETRQHGPLRLVVAR